MCVCCFLSLLLFLINICLLSLCFSAAVLVENMRARRGKLACVHLLDNSLLRGLELGAPAGYILPPARAQLGVDGHQARN